MEASGYAVLSRQSGLVREMRIIANNVANASTTGFRQEGMIFSEHIENTGDGDSLSMAGARIGNTLLTPAEVQATGATFDLAIEGNGFFLIATPGGDRLTRAGRFTPDAEGLLVTPEGHRLIDDGGAEVFVPAEAESIRIAEDGTVSADGRAIGQIQIYMPTTPQAMERHDGVSFATDGDLEAAPTARILQGFLEGSNVNPMLQVARLVEVQRAYELGQSFLETEDQRVRNAIKTLVR